jgi:hypothetical protein
VDNGEPRAHRLPGECNDVVFDLEHLHRDVLLAQAEDLEIVDDGLLGLLAGLRVKS